MIVRYWSGIWAPPARPALDHDVFCTREEQPMRVLLHLREDVTAARFMTDLARSIRAGEHKAWEVVKARPLTIRHLGRFRSVVSLKPAARRRGSGDHRPPDVIATMTGKDAGFVLRYFAGLVTMKLGAGVEGFYVPVSPD
jgi:hypothetical protein